MKNTWLNAFWGILLILGGGLFLAQNLGYLEEFSATTWMYIFIGASVLFFGTYFVSGLQHWSWLFPACIFGGLATTIWLAERGVTSSMVGAPVTGSVALPFLVVFLLDVRKNWWALIPGFIISAVTLVIMIADQTAGEVIAATILYAVALPFVIVFLTNPRERQWALIPAYVVAAVGTIPLIANQVRGEVIGAFVMFAIALPFWVVFLVSRQNWWAVIPAGILTSVGATVFLIGFWNFTNTGVAMLNGAMNLGIAATFFLLWLRRGTHPVDWAKYPAIAFLIFGAIALIFGTSFNLYWPFLLIAVGILVLFFNLRPRHV